MVEKNKVERGRPFSVLLNANENLPYMQSLYKHFNNNIEEILSFLKITNQTLWRWNVGKSKPRLIKHIAKIEEITGFSSNEIKMQYLLLEMEAEKN